jgi:hypothetical protein
MTDEQIELKGDRIDTFQIINKCAVKDPTMITSVTSFDHKKKAKEATDVGPSIAASLQFH